MKLTNKKGFTIVELVIVIAVVAILAAVLIPTFSSLIKKANLSADQQAVRQMNTALAMANNPENIDDAINALAEAGYNSKDALIPVSTGYSFYWYGSAKCVVLVKEAAVVYPEGVEYEENGVLLENSVKLIDVKSSDIKTLFNGFQNGNEEITLTGNTTVNSGNSLFVPEGAEILFDLNEKTITSGLQAGHDDKHVNVVEVKGKLTIKDGTINTRNIIVQEGGELILENVTVNALDTDGGACVWVETNAKVTIKSGTFNSNSFTYAIVNDGGEIVIENATVTAARGCVCNKSGTTTINNGAFTVTAERTDAAHVVYVYDGEIIVKGGTFTNKGDGEEYCPDSEGTGKIVDGNGNSLV